MKLVQLKHDKRLKKLTNTVSTFDISSLPSNISVIVTFDTYSFASKETVTINATSRNCVRFDGDIALVNLETRSSLAPVIFWQIAHQCQVGSSIYVYEDAVSEPFLTKSYYRKGFDISHEGDFFVLKKNSPLLAERNAGLDDWSFCLPVGPEDATFLNAAVKRILELDIENKEILLCGRPASNFKYFDEVRIVGEDIVAPPVQISKKKNRLAQEAKYSNLCILHDRVFLPSNFLSAIKKQGDLYPFTGFQSLYFFDNYNFSFCRYSDYDDAFLSDFDYCASSNNGNSVINREHLGVFEEAGRFSRGNALNYSESNYLTGSLYVCKRDVWLECPQDESLSWSEFEDVAHGMTSNKAGIPHVLNPYSITQSMHFRPIFAYNYTISYMTPSHRAKLSKSRWANLSFLNRKPLINVVFDDVKKKFSTFCSIYNIVDLDVDLNRLNSSYYRYSAILDVLSSLELKQDKIFAGKLYNDICKFLLLQQVIFSQKEYFIDVFVSKAKTDRDIKLAIINAFPEIASQAYMSIISKPFSEKLDDYFISNTNKIGFRLGSYLSAGEILSNGALELDLSKKELFSLILDTTPTREYCEH